MNHTSAQVFLSRVVNTPTELISLGPLTSATFSICRMIFSILSTSHGVLVSSSNGVILKNRPRCNITTWFGQSPSASKIRWVFSYHVSKARMTFQLKLLAKNFKGFTCCEIIMDFINTTRTSSGKTYSIEEELHLMHRKWSPFPVFILWHLFISKFWPEP